MLFLGGSAHGRDVELGREDPSSWYRWIDARTGNVVTYVRVQFTADDDHGVGQFYRDAYFPVGTTEQQAQALICSYLLKQWIRTSGDWRPKPGVAIVASGGKL